MSDVDDELLAALAETSSEEEERARPSASKSKGRESTKRRRPKEDLVSEDEESQGDDEDAQGSDDEDENDGERFMLDGIYKDEEDRDRLLDMTEIDREEELARRRDIISARSSKAQLAALVRSQKKAAAHSSTRRRGAAPASDDSDSDGEYGKVSSAAAAAKGRKRKAVGASETKSAKLAELRQRRKDKAAGVAARRGGDSGDEGGRSRKKRRGARGSDSEDDAEDSESAYSEEDRYVAPKSGRGDAAKKFKTSTEPPSLAELNKVRLGRSQVEKIIYRPKWEDVLVGSFIRLSWGFRRDDRGNSEQFYRIHEVLATHRTKRYYDIGNGTYTCITLIVAVGEDRSEMPISHISNDPYTERERERWISLIQSTAPRDRRTGERKRAAFPRVESLMHKKGTTDEYLFMPRTEKDMQIMLQAKKEAKASYFERKGNGAPGAKTDDRSAPLSQAPQSQTPGRTPAAAGALPSTKATPTTSEKTMAEMNARNRREDKERLYEADKKAALVKRMALGFAKSAPSSGAATPPVTAQAQPTTAAPLGAAAPASTMPPSILQDIEVDLGAF